MKQKPSECDPFELNDKKECVFPLCDCGEVLNVKTSSQPKEKTTTEKYPTCCCHPKHANYREGSLCGFHAGIKLNEEQDGETQEELWEEIITMIQEYKYPVFFLKEKFNIQRKPQ